VELEFKTIEPGRVRFLINVAFSRSILNQCFALGWSKYFCNNIGPKADIDLQHAKNFWRSTAQRLSITKSRK
jgi:hypothetical protein